ncbi:thiamine phosphate synthase [Candidatus Poribacteria bacterium]|nr:thiamine phosphate synthase [Candidatus Poribacteria bacterium]
MIKDKFRHSHLYVITDYALSKGRLITKVVAKAIAGGAGIIQLRDKESTAKKLIKDGLALRELTKEKNVIFIVNDRVDVALAVDADGVHLGQDDFPINLARKIIGEDKIIGVSVGSVEEAIHAVKDSADYISIGSIFPTQTKPDAGDAVGTQIITEIKKYITVPLVAIGGITADNIGEVAKAGADCAAVISAVAGADDIEEAARCLIRRFLGGLHGTEI